MVLTRPSFKMVQLSRERRKNNLAKPKSRALEKKRGVLKLKALAMKEMRPGLNHSPKKARGRVAKSPEISQMKEATQAKNQKQLKTRKRNSKL